MMHREPRHHGIESRIGKWQLGRIAFAEGDVVNPGRGATLRRFLQHLRGKIERHHLARGFRDRGTENARTAGDVEDGALRRLAQGVDKTLRQRRIGNRRRSRERLRLPVNSSRTRFS
jgi:hypothetical protein